MLTEVELADRIEEFCRRTGESLAGFGRRVARDGNLVSDLRQGRSPRLRLVRDILAAMQMSGEADTSAGREAPSIPLPAPRPRTEKAFFAWLDRQDRRHELVAGAPRAMVGATQRHDRIVTNLIVALATRLRDGGCRTGTANTAIRIPGGNIRYPDLSVDCGRFEETARTATEPALVAEVLSPSTAAFDEAEKLEEYRSVASLRHILLVDPDQPRLRVHTREADGRWGSVPVAGLDVELVLAALGLRVPLAEVYEGLGFREGPRWVEG